MARSQIGTAQGAQRSFQQMSQIHAAVAPSLRGTKGLHGFPLNPDQFPTQHSEPVRVHPYSPFVGGETSTPRKRQQK